MHRKLLRPTVELFSDGEILDSIDLYRHGAFTGMSFPFRRLRCYGDHVELSFPASAGFSDNTKTLQRPPQVILIEWRPLHFGGAFPYFLCYKCGYRARRLYLNSIDVACRHCAELQFASQRQRRRARLETKAENIRARLWIEGEKISRPRYMFKTTYRKHMHMLHMIEHAIRSGARISSPRLRRYRERDQHGRYCD